MRPINNAGGRGSVVNKMMRIAAFMLAAVMLMLCGSAFAMSVGDRKYAFVDKEVEKAVRAQLGRDKGPVYLSDLDSVEYLYFEYVSVEQVYDILNCRNITAITFDHTVVNDFSRLGTMNTLETITIIASPVDDSYFVNGFYGLKNLHIEDCALESLEGIGGGRNRGLESLTVRNCGIYDISPLAMQRGLKYLDVSGNNITCIDDLWQLSELVYIDVSYNPVYDTDVLRYLPKLQYVNADGTGEYEDTYEEVPAELWGLAVKNISTRTGPSTKYAEGGTYKLSGQYVRVLSRAWDANNDIWWVEVEIHYNGEVRYLWTGYHRFDSTTLPLESIPISDNTASSGGMQTFDGVWGLAVKNISTRTGPSTKYAEGGTYKLSGQYVKVLSRAWDASNDIWWVEVEINYNGEVRYLWTGYHRFDSATLPLDSIPVAK